MVGSRKALISHACYKLGNNECINPWEDPWFPNLPNKVLEAKEEVDTSQWDPVEKLKMMDGTDWNWELLLAICEPWGAEAISLFGATTRRVFSLLVTTIKLGV